VRVVPHRFSRPPRQGPPGSAGFRGAARIRRRARNGRKTAFLHRSAEGDRWYRRRSVKKLIGTLESRSSQRNLSSLSGGRAVRSSEERGLFDRPPVRAGSRKNLLGPTGFLVPFRRCQ
jgi:hypothetical protein